MVNIETFNSGRVGGNNFLLINAGVAKTCAQGLRASFVPLNLQSKIHKVK
jgi:hypothetical protein